MNASKSLITILLVIVGAAGYLNYRLNNFNQAQNCTPTFADGDGPYYRPNAPFRTKIVPDQNQGQKLVVSGKVLRSDCKTALKNVTLDIWQADETGKYQNDWYRGQIKTDRYGRYQFETIIPKGYGEGTGYRPPHIHFKAYLDNQLIITSEMFFPESLGKPGFNDAFFIQLSTQTIKGVVVSRGQHNIILPI